MTTGLGFMQSGSSRSNGRGTRTFKGVFLQLTQSEEVEGVLS